MCGHLNRLRTTTAVFAIFSPQHIFYLLYTFVYKVFSLLYYISFFPNAVSVQRNAKSFLTKEKGPKSKQLIEMINRIKIKIFAVFFLKIKYKSFYIIMV